MVLFLVYRGNSFKDCYILLVEDFGIEKFKVICRGLWYGGETEVLKKFDVVF